MAIRGIHLFSLFGFDVKLDLSWLLLALLISWSLGAGLFPNDYPGLSTYNYAAMGIAVAIGVFFSIVFHEFAHSLVARRFGLAMRGITLFIFGGVAEMEDEPPNPKAEFLIAIAGPVSSFVLALVLWVIHGAAVSGAWPVTFIGVCHTLALINFTVAVFNLVPAFPLDGGRVLRAVLWRWKHDLRAATATSSRIGRGFGLALMILGVIAFLQGNLIAGTWWFLIGIFVRGAASASYQQLLLRDMVQGQPVRRFMKSDPITVPPSISVEEWIEDYVYRHHFKLFPVVDGSTLLGCVSIESIKSLPRSDWGAKTVRDLMQPCSAANTIPADTDAIELLSDVLQPGRPSRYMVVDGKQLLGMISLKDLLELISLKLEIETGR